MSSLLVRLDVTAGTKALPVASRIWPICGNYRQRAQAVRAGSAYILLRHAVHLLFAAAPPPPRGIRLFVRKHPAPLLQRILERARHKQPAAAAGERLQLGQARQHERLQRLVAGGAEPALAVAHLAPPVGAELGRRALLEPAHERGRHIVAREQVRVGRVLAHERGRVLHARAAQRGDGEHAVGAQLGRERRALRAHVRVGHEAVGLEHAGGGARAHQLGDDLAHKHGRRGRVQRRELHGAAHASAGARARAPGGAYPVAAASTRLAASLASSK